MTTRNYEAMFILENSAASADFEATAGKVDEILEKHGATLVQKEKWDERKLAYEIKGQRRGTYYLVYFQTAPESLRRIGEDLRLTETVLRHMMIALDEPIDEHIAKRAAERERLAEDSRKNALAGWGAGPRRGGGGRREDRGRSRSSDDDEGPRERHRESKPGRVADEQSAEAQTEEAASKP